MLKKLQDLYRNATIASKIQICFFTVLIPMIIMVIVCVVNMSVANNRYRKMIQSAVVASEFSLDFKKDFDYETYLVVVENKTLDESDLGQLFEDANRIVAELYELTPTGENNERLQSADKYLQNLQIYIDRIKLNLDTGNMYEENMLIWENDVQIVTSLIKDTLNEFIFYEIRDMQDTREHIERINHSIILITSLAAMLIFVLSVIYSILISRSITKPIYEAAEVTRQVADGDLSVRTHIEYGDEVKTLGDSLNLMIDKIEELLDQVTVEQVRLRHAELELLQSQINPHFLYNTLDTIVWLAEAGEQSKVVSMVGSLSKFFRTSLNQGKDMITIGEELQHARSYLEIQQVRYQDIMKYEITVPDDLFGYVIPKITIQPLVENALYHGIKNKRGMGCIQIYAKHFKDYFEIIVKDDGIGVTEDRLNQIRDRIAHLDPDSKEIFGLYNVNERIALRLGEEYGISITSVYGQGSVVSIKLPYIVDVNYNTTSRLP